LARLCFLSAASVLFATLTTTTLVTAVSRSDVPPFRTQWRVLIPSDFFALRRAAPVISRIGSAFFLDIDDKIVWEEVAFILECDYRIIAPNALIAKLDRNDGRSERKTSSSDVNLVRQIMSYYRFFLILVREGLIVAVVLGSARRSHHRALALRKSWPYD
jgi:hypothetical protein